MRQGAGFFIVDPIPRNLLNTNLRPCAPDVSSQRSFRLFLAFEIAIKKISGIGLIQIRYGDFFFSSDYTPAYQPYVKSHQVLP